MKDWQAWHAQYDDPSTHLPRRLAVVQQLIRDWLDVAPEGPLRVVSGCAGDGRDLLGTLQGHSRAGDVRGVLVELDPVLSTASAVTPGIEARCADAGLLSTYEGAHDADLLLLCGIFGNVSGADIESTVRQASRLTSPGATAIWTRHRHAPDITPALRRWWVEAGWQETAFVSDGPDDFAVGCARLTVAPLPYLPEGRLFTFV